MEQKFEHHTIVNKDVVNKLINNANIKKNDIILEIGPGNGVITKELCKFSKKVITVEKDINCREFLDILLNKNSNLEVIYSNILDIIIPNFDKLIANLPFNVFEPVITFFENLHNSFVITPFPGPISRIMSFFLIFALFISLLTTSLFTIV